jgi:hypothetical protein
MKFLHIELVPRFALRCSYNLVAEAEAAVAELVPRFALRCSYNLVAEAEAAVAELAPRFALRYKLSNLQDT